MRREGEEVVIAGLRACFQVQGRVMAIAISHDTSRYQHPVLGKASQISGQNYCSSEE